VRAIALKHGVCYVPERFCSWRKMPGSISQAFRADAERTLEIVEKSAALMASEPFADRFPLEYVERWKRAARRHVLWSYWLGEDYLPRGARRNFLVRNFARLRRLPELAALACRRIRPKSI
jgi:hypothetical protein